MSLLTRAEVAALVGAERNLTHLRRVSRARALAVMQPGGVDHSRQLALIVAFLDAHAYALTGMVRGLATDAVALVRTGAFDVVVAAYATSRGGLTAVEVDLVEAGARVEYVRARQREYKPRRDVGDLAERMLAEGLAPEVVAKVLDLPEEHVRVVVADRGRRPQRRH